MKNVWRKWKERLNLDRASIVRVLLFIASALAYLGVNIPESTVEFVSYVVFGAIGLYGLYKNNYLFERGKKQKQLLDKFGLYDETK